jgi:hypothetical protein
MDTYFMRGSRTPSQIISSDEHDVNVVVVKRLLSNQSFNQNAQPAM